MLQQSFDEAQSELSVEREKLMQMRRMLSDLNTRVKKKKQVLYPVKEDNNVDASKMVYRGILIKVHSDLKQMMIGQHMKGSFFKSQSKLNNLVQEIDAMKNGNYVIMKS